MKKNYTLAVLLSLSIFGMAQDYFPMAKGNQWNFTLTLEGDVYDYNWTIEDSIHSNGTDYFYSIIEIPGLLRDSTYCYNQPGNENLILMADTIGKLETDILFLHTVTKDTMVVNGTDTIDIEYFGEVTVPAGTFQNVYTSVDRSDTLSRIFFAPDVGYIRQDSEGETILVLESYSFGGVVTSTKEISGSSIKLFPNPTSNSLSITSGKPISNYQIWDLTGKLVSSGIYENSIDVSALTQGTYMITLKSSNETSTKRFVKK